MEKNWLQDNTAIGYQSLNNTTGSSNTALGRGAGQSNSSGTGNIFLGHQAGLYQTTTSNQLFISNFDAGSAANDSSKSLIHGIMSSTTANQRLRINAKVGIGTSTPNYGGWSNALSILGTTTHAAVEIAYGGVAADASNIGALDFIIPTNTTNKEVAQVAAISEGSSTNEGAALRFYTKPDAGAINERVRILGNGNVGIGTTAPDKTLSVVGSARVTGDVYLNKATLGTSDTMVIKDGTLKYKLLSTATVGISSTSTIAKDSTTNAEMYPVFVTARTGNLPLKDAGNKLHFNPSTGSLTASGDANISGITVGVGGGGLTDNVAIGFQSAIVNLNARNTSIGGYSLFKNTYGADNTVVGNGGLFENISGSYNTSLGSNTGISSLGNGNIFLGFSAGGLETGDSTLYIDDSYSATPLIKGNFKVGAKRITVNGALTVTGSVTISPMTTAGVVHNAVTTGLLSSSLIVNDDITNSTINLATKVTGVLPIANGGTNASTSSITSFNNITGYTASGATGTTSTNLVFSTSPVLITPTLGVATATTINTLTVGLGGGSVADNTAIGVNALLSNTNGAYNTAVGHSAGYSNTTGSGNVFLGATAGYSSSGNDNLYIANSSTPTPLIGGNFTTPRVDIGGHLRSTVPTTPPTITDTTSTATPAISGTDTKGVVTVSSVTGTPSNSEFKIVFNTPYLTTPVVVISNINATAGTIQTDNISKITPQYFVVYVKNATVASTKFTYMVIE